MLNKIILGLIYFKIILDLCNCLHFIFGECPIYYEEPCSPDMVKFILSTRKGNISKIYQLNPFKLHLPEDFNNRTPIKILIHGYGGLSIDRAIKSVMRAYQSLGYNVILVDWSPLSQVPCYATAFLNTWHVGQCIAILSVSLIPLGIAPSSLHLIGFSLGAHIAGFTGDNLNKVLKIKPGRITGLDPALPFFATLNNDWKLDPSDAKFVDIIHTSVGTFGKIEAMGHVDFYVNGGILQPACFQAPYPPLCSHAMAGIYFAESIKGGTFVGRQCDNIANYILGFCSKNRKAIMGEYVSTRTNGTFFVDISNLTTFKSFKYTFKLIY